jgi:SAM-dependent methyltransferase
MSGSIEGADGDVIFGRLAADAPEAAQLAVKGRDPIGITGAYPVCEPSGRLLQPRGMFRVLVPGVTACEEVPVELLQAGTTLDRRMVVIEPTVHANGLSAGDLRALHRFPLVATNGMAIQAGQLDVSGLVLAPDGDPRRVSVLVDDSDAGFDLVYPLPNAGARAIYWYWPNADWTTYKISVNLSAKQQSRRAAYKVQFQFDADDSELSALKNSFYIPKSLSAFESFPKLDRLRRVQRYENASGVAMRGYSDCRRMVSLAEIYGLRCDNRSRVLDWGCGHGRVIRHFPSVVPGVKAVGIDIDADNVDWARQNLPDIDFYTGPLMPPTEFADGTFDLVYGISVMTHLTRSVQLAWLEEIRRILAPGGLALLTFAGDTSVAFASRFLTPEWLADYRSRGFGADLPSDDLAGLIADPDYYRNVKVGASGVARLCTGMFDVCAVLECMFGYQDLAVLRRP